MLNIKTLPLGAYQTNTYLVWEENSPTCVVIDPGYQPDTIRNKLLNIRDVVGSRRGQN